MKTSPPSSSTPKLIPHLSAFILSSLSLLLSSCAPKVQLATPEPLKVDISMQVDVYQRETGVSTSRKMSEEELQSIRRSEDRAGEIWSMKNDGAALEGLNGYLEARPKSGWDSEYVTRLIADENRDRRIKYEAEARDTARPLETVEAEAGKRLREQAYVTKSVKESPPAEKK